MAPFRLHFVHNSGKKRPKIDSKIYSTLALTKNMKQRIKRGSGCHHLGSISCIVLHTNVKLFGHIALATFFYRIMLVFILKTVLKCV